MVSVSTEEKVSEDELVPIALTEPPKNLQAIHDRTEPTGGLRKHLTFFRVHLLYFILLGFVGGSILYGIESNSTKVKVSFIDALFTSYSALCVTGLAVVDTSLLKTSSVVLIGVLIQLGSSVMMSLLPLMIRRRYMHNHAKDVDSRRDLLGIQYRAMGRLMWIIIGYIGVSYVASFLFLVVFIYLSPNLKEIIAQQGVSGPASFASFHVISSFNNAGFSLFSTNLIPFRDASVVLMVLGALILLGNTLYPVALRSIVCLFRKYASREHGRDEYQYLLDHPRECFTHLFPELNTHILLITSIVFNCFEMILFIAYDWNLAILNGSSGAEKFFAGVFSSVSTRTAGFNVVDLAVISPTLQFVQLLLMYVASVPGIVTLRSSTVVGVDTIQVAEDDEETALEKIPSSFKRILVWFRNRNFMLREASLLLVFVLLICFVEDPKLSNDANFTIFKVLYESASGFGTVGLSLGYPNTVTSLSAQFNAAAKIFMCCIMLLGRHRGLPTSLDPAVQLTSDNKELELNSTRAHLQNEFSEFNKFDQEGRLVPVVPPQISPSDVRLRRVKTYA